MIPGGDPFVASLVVAPLAATCKMSEMEKKQKLLMNEQLIWQQYDGNGRQGQIEIEFQYSSKIEKERERIFIQHRSLY